MRKEELMEDLISILKRVRDCEINDLDKDLFGSYYDYTSGEMLDVFMGLRKKLVSILNPIYLNQMFY